MYLPRFISIPFVLSEVWPRQAFIMKKLLQGNNSINIQGRIMVLGDCPSPHNKKIFVIVKNE